MRQLLVSALLVFASFTAQAGQSESEDAVTNILFDENMENVSYSLRGDGFVDISFGIAVAEQDYIRIVERMRKTRQTSQYLTNLQMVNRYRSSGPTLELIARTIDPASGTDVDLVVLVYNLAR